jgi:hypothetical protein
VLDVLLGVLYTVVAWRIDLALERRRQARMASAFETS